jgi:hypothetical protein
VTADARQDREVEHLHREDERGDQAGHRGESVVEVPAATGEADRQADRGHDGVADRHGTVEDPVGDVH